MRRLPGRLDGLPLGFLEVAMNDENGVVIGWARAAQISGMPASSLRRRAERGEIIPQKGENSTNIFQRADLLALRPKLLETAIVSLPAPELRPPAVVPSPNDPVDAGVVPDIFDDLQSGLTPTQIVIKRRLPTEFVKRAYDEWVGLQRLDPKAMQLPAVISALEKKVGDLTGQVEELERNEEDHWQDHPVLAHLDGAFDCPECKERAAVKLQVQCGRCSQDFVLTSPVRSKEDGCYMYR
jgi:hypothetical protein